MAHKKKHLNPVPPGNQSHNGPAQAAEEVTDGEAPAHEEESKRRLGDFNGTGEHSIQQPGGKNDSNH